MSRIELRAPLSGWVLPLAQVRDEAFASGLVGDGVAIDPIDGTLWAPFDGVVVLPGNAKHALSVRHAGGAEILMHVGIDTVSLRGEGFELLVENGRSVRAGDALLRFDLDFIARNAPSAVTPVLLASGGKVTRRIAECAVRAGEFLFEIELDAVAAISGMPQIEMRRRFRVPFDHGLHARPAAQVVAALRATTCRVELTAHGRRANARSAVALMSLGVQAGDEVEAVAQGADAGAALESLAALLAPVEVAAVSEKRVMVVPQLPKELRGIVASRGIAIGISVALRDDEIEVSETGRGEVVERDALGAALARVSANLESLAATAGTGQRDVLEAHAALLDDPEIAALADTELRAGKSAAFAWRQALRSTIETLSRLDDERMRERAADLRDLERQVLRTLAGESPSAAHALPDNAIVFADELLPSQLTALDASRLAGIVMARGGPTSHVALLAAARGIPALVATGEQATWVPDGHTILLDAERGRVAIDPPASELASLRERAAERAQRAASDLAQATHPAATRDGTRIHVNANIGAVSEAMPACAHGAEGCGLLRTEFLFLDRRAAPDEDEQQRIYAAVAAGFGERTLTIRVLDVGGDKPLAYLPLPREENPALGVRGLRVGLRSPALLRTQLRAILRAGPAKSLRILLPMVNDLAELRATRELLHECAQQLGIDSLPALGVMIETPAAALLADQLAREADFLSIGSNDLSQYVLAIDRAHAELAAGLDGLHPAVLRLIAQVAAAGKRANCGVSVCGGLASEIEALPVLIGLGIRDISVVPAGIPRIKRRVRELDLSACEALARQALDCESAGEVRALVARLAHETTAPRVRAAGLDA